MVDQSIDIGWIMPDQFTLSTKICNFSILIAIDPFFAIGYLNPDYILYTGGPNVQVRD
jgi:hypothetical protein